VPVLPPPPPGDAAVDWVAEHLGDLCGEPPRASSIRGGQAAADAALAALNLTGYASQRSQVLPVERRGATRMSPYVRHGLLTLPQLWAVAKDAPYKDRQKYRDELLWQEYARHVYARLGGRTAQDYRVEQPRPERWPDPWPRQMACMDFVRDELETDGWLVNQTRMWVASQWSVRAGHDWREGEDALYRRLLDGSRAANRLGWQWTVGTGSGKAVRLLALAGREAGAAAVRPLPRARPLPDPGVAGRRRRSAGGTTRGLVDGTTDGGPVEVQRTGSRRRCG
jgi:deoxyribodipyrimidine photo-lyase